MKFSELKIGDKFYHHFDRLRRKEERVVWIRKDISEYLNCESISANGYGRGVCQANDEVELIHLTFADLSVGDHFKGLEEKHGGKNIWVKIKREVNHNAKTVEDKEYIGLWTDSWPVERVEVVKETKPVEEKVEMSTKVENAPVVVTKDGTMTVVLDNTPHIVSTSHPNYSTLREAVRNKDWDKFRENINVADKVVKALSSSTGKTVEISGNTILVNGEALHNSLTERILTLLKEGFDIQPMVKFLENLVKNPSARAVNETHDFLDHKNLPITEDGCFLAYKSVGSDWYSKAAGKLRLIQGTTNGRGQIYNAIGETIECPRNQVDDERQHECSHGLHVGCLDYSGPSGWYHNASDHVVIVKINPADCVAVPRDHNAQKLRVCKYEVIGEFKGALNKPVYKQDEVAEYDDEYTEAVDEVFEDYMDIEDVYEDDQIAFEYEGKKRYAEVLGVHDDHLHCQLLNPEDSVGEYRNFLFDKMDKVRLL